MSSPQTLEQALADAAQEGVQVGMGGGGQSEREEIRKKTQPLGKGVHGGLCLINAQAPSSLKFTPVLPCGAATP